MECIFLLEYTVRVTTASFVKDLVDNAHRAFAHMCLLYDEP